MKLIDLDPRWWRFENTDEHVGLTFLCPHCQKQRLGIAFHNLGHEAIEDQYIKAHDGSGRYIWTNQNNGDFTNLTLTPSIDASASGHWHGFITNGEIQ